MPTVEEMRLLELIAQREAVRRAIRSPLTVTHGDKSVKNRSVKELQIALADLNAEIGDLGGLPVRRVRYASVRKGL